MGAEETVDLVGGIRCKNTAVTISEVLAELKSIRKGVGLASSKLNLEKTPAIFLVVGKDATPTQATERVTMAAGKIRDDIERGAVMASLALGRYSSRKLTDRRHDYARDISRSYDMAVVYENDGLQELARVLCEGSTLGGRRLQIVIEAASTAIFGYGGMLHTITDEKEVLRTEMLFNDHSKAIAAHAMPFFVYGVNPLDRLEALAFNLKFPSDDCPDHVFLFETDNAYEISLLNRLRGISLDNKRMTSDNPLYPVFYAAIINRPAPKYFGLYWWNEDQNNRLAESSSPRSSS